MLPEPFDDELVRRVAAEEAQRWAEVLKLLAERDQEVSVPA